MRKNGRTVVEHDCLECGIHFDSISRNTPQGAISNFKKRKFCSRKCAKINIAKTPGFAEEISLRNKIVCNTSAHKAKMSLAIKKVYQERPELRIPTLEAIEKRKTALNKSLKVKAVHAFQRTEIYRESKRGSKNREYKDGRTPLVIQIRHLPETTEWRQKVFQRDDYTCQECNSYGGKLNADHIKAFSVIFTENKISSIKEAINCKEFWDINNGRTLCVDCHRKTPTWGGYSRISIVGSAILT